MSDTLRVDVSFPWPRPVESVVVTITVPPGPIPVRPPLPREELLAIRRREVWEQFHNRCAEIDSLLTKQPNNFHRTIRAANQLIRLMQFVQAHERNGTL